MTTTIQHVHAPSGRLTVISMGDDSVALPGFLGEAEATKIATKHFQSLGDPLRFGRLDPGAGWREAGVGPGGVRGDVTIVPGNLFSVKEVELSRRVPMPTSVQGRFLVDRPEHGALWIARKFHVSTDDLVRANPGLPTMRWNGRVILSLQMGDVVNIPVQAVPRGHFYDIRMAAYRPHPTERSTHRTMVMLGEVPRMLGGDAECYVVGDDDVGISWPYDGNSCNGGAGTCNGGTCVEYVNPGVPNHTPGALPNFGNPCPAGMIPDAINPDDFCMLDPNTTTCDPGFHWDPVGNTCCQDGWVFSTTQGNTCVPIAGGITGDCLPYSPQNADGYCVDIDCPVTMYRANPGEDCLPWTADACAGYNGIFDEGTCLAQCNADEAYNFTYHSCYCKAPLTRDASGACVNVPPPATPCPPGSHASPSSPNGCALDAPPPIPQPCPTGTVAQAPGPSGQTCIPATITCPQGQMLDTDGVTCIAKPASGGAADSGSNTGFIIGALALLGIGTAVVLSKKKGKGSHAHA